MNAIYSIHHEFTKLIFDGTKSLEFRNSIGNKIQTGDRIHVYETKKNHGAGAVIGYFTIKDIKKIPYHKTGTYFILPYYVEKFGTEEDKNTVKSAMGISLNDYDESIVLNYLYDQKSLDYMKTTHEVPDILSNMYRGYSPARFNQLHEKADKLCKACDAWAKQIGYYDLDDSSYWKYAIEITNPKKYDSGKPISDFQNSMGEVIKRAPQSWCYTID